MARGLLTVGAAGLLLAGVPGVVAQTGAGAPAAPVAVPDTGAIIRPGASYTPPARTAQPATSTVGASENTAVPVPLQGTGPDAANVSRYRLQPGDTVSIRYRQTPEYNQAATLQPEGTATLRLLGPVHLEGLTAAEARKRINDLAAKRLSHPEVSVELTNTVGPHFTVMGQVGKPGRYVLKGPVTVQDALAIAGGLKDTARHTQLVLVHRIDETIGSTQLIDVRQFERTPKPGTELVSLQPDDILVVPKSKLANVERYVKIASFGFGTSFPVPGLPRLCGAQRKSERDGQPFPLAFTPWS